jgi:hypothetical protein
MRLRERGRQNSPRRKSAKELERERKEQQAKTPEAVNDLATILDKHKRTAIPKSKPLPKGIPVPRNYRRNYVYHSAYSYTEEQIAVAKGILVETSIGLWPTAGTLSLASYSSAEARYKLASVYEVQRSDKEYKALLKTFHEAGIAPNVQRVYHGTKQHSLAGIALNSLIQSNHGMFGKGIYVAPSIYKAIGYTDVVDNAFVFLADAIIGNPFVAEEAMKKTNPEEMWTNGYHSIHGKSNFTNSYTHKLNYDEYCVFYHNQIHLRLLARFERKK